MTKKKLYKLTVEFYVEATSVEEAKENAIFGMDEGTIAIGESSILKVEESDK